MVDELLDARTATDHLINSDGRFGTDAGLAGDLVASLDPATAAAGPDRTPEAVPEDPLCARPSPRP
jgi:hypothetical protein